MVTVEFFVDDANCRAADVRAEEDCGAACQSMACERQRVNPGYVEYNRQTIDAKKLARSSEVVR